MINHQEGVLAVHLREMAQDKGLQYTCKMLRSAPDTDWLPQIESVVSKRAHCTLRRSENHLGMPIEGSLVSKWPQAHGEDIIRVAWHASLSGTMADLLLDALP